MAEAGDEQKDPNGWRSGLFKRLLDASAAFARLDADLRSDVLPDRSIPGLEALASQLESDLESGALHRSLPTSGRGCRRNWTPPAGRPTSC
mgnify:CR=1 FL=1